MTKAARSRKYNVKTCGKNGRIVDDFYATPATADEKAKERGWDLRRVRVTEK